MTRAAAWSFRQNGLLGAEAPMTAMSGRQGGPANAGECPGRGTHLCHWEHVQQHMLSQVLLDRHSNKRSLQIGPLMTMS